ncbi:type I-E CRISPR-associated protein Cas6/Cse3/CasE [Haloferula chungangensis]|uniref:Type I-E CRISPR-associated protein Cas6/Cse3/CasE n=1 Tax=Haloferula chungangensis TaxID=1048331 RepID=A0ABW2LC66_9BACT
MNTESATLHLARIVLPYETAAKRGIHDPYHWHQRAWDAFPGREKDTRNFLTRIDQKEQGWQLLLLSSWHPERPDWCPDHPQNWGVKAIADSFLTHDRYRFSIRANPVIKRVQRNAAGERIRSNKREPLRTPGELLPWLERQAESHGFELIGTPRIDQTDHLHFSRAKDQRHGVHHLVDFSGILRPIDPISFRQAFEDGIGPAKAFGFGMLCLSPLS